MAMGSKGDPKLSSLQKMLSADMREPAYRAKVIKHVTSAFRTQTMSLAKHPGGNYALQVQLAALHIINPHKACSVPLLPTCDRIQWYAVHLQCITYQCFITFVLFYPLYKLYLV
jgi:hypothetical protein